MMTLLLFLLFGACVAFTFGNGIWTNALLLVNLITAALLAMNFYEPLAHWLWEKGPSFKYLWDFLSLWGLFALFLGILRGITDAVSKVKVKFKKPVDQAGGILLACWVAWIMVCFTAASLHVAPLPRTFMGFATHPSERLFLSPDLRWLSFMHKMSRGGYSRSASHVFDPRGEFVLKYAQRRKSFENTQEKAILTNEQGE